MKYAVQAVILNDKNEILAVSRKDNHADFGLVGGKMDVCDYLLEDAIIREIKEETGLIARREDLTLIFSMHKNGYMGYTYLVNKWYGTIETDEPHVVKWTSIEEVIRGRFGYWNSLVHESLKDMGIDVYSERKEALKEMSNSSENVEFKGVFSLCKTDRCSNVKLEFSKYCEDCYEENYPPEKYGYKKY